jgi:hypothetical protein
MQIGTEGLRVQCRYRGWRGAWDGSAAKRRLYGIAGVIKAGGGCCGRVCRRLYMRTMHRFLYFL